MVIGFSIAFTMLATPLLPNAAVVPAAITVLMAAIVSIAFRPRRRVRAVTAALFCIGAAFFYYAVRESTDMAPLMQLPDHEYGLTAVVDEMPQSTAGGSLYVMRVTKGALKAGTRFTLFQRSETETLSMGDAVTGVFAMRLRDGLDDAAQRRYAKAEGLLLTATVDGDLTRLGAATDWRSAVARVRAAGCRLLDRRFVSDVAGILRATCFGDRSGISDGWKTAYRKAGLSHLLAVSGLHLSIVAGGVYLVLRKCRMRRRPASVIGAAVTVAFMALTGFSGSVSRAGAMVLCLFAARLAFRETDSMNALGIALTGILLVSPYAAWDIGLQLSVTATVGVVRLFEPMRERLDRALADLAGRIGKRWWQKPLRTVAESGMLTLSATVLLVVPMAFQFGALSLVSPIANLVTVPTATLTVGGGILALLLGWIPLIGTGVSVMTGLCVKWQLWLVSVFAKVPFAESPTYGVLIRICLVGGFVVFLLCRYTLVRRRLAIGCLASVYLVAVLATVWLTPTVRVAVLPMEKDVAVCLQVRGKTGVFCSMRDAGAAARLTAALEQMEVVSLDFVALTDADGDGAYMLDAFCERWAEATVYLPPAGRYLTRITEEISAKRLRFTEPTIEVWQMASFVRHGQYSSLTVCDQRFLLAGAGELTEPVIGDVAVFGLMPQPGFENWTVEKMTVNGAWRATTLPVYATDDSYVILYERGAFA